MELQEDISSRKKGKAPFLLVALGAIFLLVGVCSVCMFVVVCFICIILCMPFWFVACLSFVCD